MRTLPMFAIVLTGCLRTTTFTCTDDASCGTNGRCESTNYCSVPDPACPDNRYVPSAGSYAGECVGQVGGGPDANGVDASPDGPSRCPTGFTTLPMLTGPGHHLYMLRAADDFDSQYNACANISHTYLAIPDDLAELTALAAAQAPPQWVGIRRVGGDFFNSKLDLAQYLPWQGGTPMDGGGKDCAAIVSPTEIQTDTCNTHHPAYCECEP